MSPTVVFLGVVALIAFASVGIVTYVSKSLRMLLIELCGTAARASFWLSFSNVVLVLVPLIFVLGYTPEIDANRNWVFEMAAQFKYGLIGFVATLTLLSIVLLRFVPSKAFGNEASRPRG